MAAADALESGGRGGPPDGPGGAMPAGTDSFLHSASIKQQPPGLSGSGSTGPPVDTFIQAKSLGPEAAFLTCEQQPLVHSSLSSASGSHGTFTPLANALAIATATSSSANAPATPRAQRGASSQPTISRCADCAAH